MRPIKSILVILTSSVALASLSSASIAADAPIYQPDLPVEVYGDPTDAGKWTGFYAGAHLGGVTTQDLANLNADNVRFSGGVQGGYLQQFGMFVMGAELEASVANDLTYALAPGAALRENWSIVAKGRAGVALGDTLLYGTAGLSLANLEGTGTAVASTETNAGIAFGAGVEQRLTDQLSIRAEYLQTQYLDVGSSVGGIGRTDNLTNHALNVGLNFHF